MRTETDNQASLMRRYLLGELPESEQIALEEQFFTSRNSFEQVQEIEHELVDGYVRQQLSPIECEQFERHYLTTPEHQARVKFARELLRAAHEEEAAQSAQQTGIIRTESFWQKLLATLRAPQFALGAAAAAAILILVGGIWLAGQRERWRQQLAQSQADRLAGEKRVRELEAQIAQQRESNAQLSPELERLREEQRLAAEQPPPTQPSIFSFILLPIVRGGSEQQILKIPSGVNQIQLQMKIERGSDQRYRVSLRPVDGGESWQPSAVKASPRAGGATISVNIPANRLTSGDYTLTLTGVSADGPVEEINRYFFRVSK